jgi:hypothetical protein
MYDSKICTSYLVYSQIWLNLPMGSKMKQYFKVSINVFSFWQIFAQWQPKKKEKLLKYKLKKI